MTDNRTNYTCSVCGWTAADTPEAQRDHCPNCLCSTHEEDTLGLSCGGRLEPISIWVKPDNTWEIIRRCAWCGELHTSPLTEEDNPIKVMSIAALPLAEPPFPLENT